MRTYSEYLNGTDSERLSINEKLECEAKEVAYKTGRYLTTRDGIVYNKRFIEEYVAMCTRLE